MKQEQREFWAINQLFIFLAMLFIILFSLKAASEIIVPILISLVISIILSPLFSFLESKNISKGISLIVIVFLALMIIIFFGGYVINEAKDFIANYQTIKMKFLESEHHLLAYLKNFGITIEEARINSVFEQSNLIGMIKKFIAQANNQFSNLFIIFFMVAFMLLESDGFYAKIIRIAKDYDIDSKIFLEILEKIKSYFLIKAKTSLLTGTLVLAILWFYNIPYYYMWAVLAFFLNFIPVVGSILAAIPAVLFAFVTYDFITMVWISLWYLGVNMLVGNFLEPRIMGKGLGMSALVIFISMTFWGWLFGPTGMILSVPLTMVVQYIFAQYHETKWISLMLSDFKEI